MSKEKHSKIFQHKVVNRYSVDDIDNRIENKKWGTGDENEDGRDSVDAGDDKMMLKTYCVKK